MPKGKTNKTADKLGTSTIKSDIISGFSVSLIALPLCLGIALASGVPPLAGLITAIVGGIFGSRISGSFVTISGPAAGLIVVILAGVESMGGAGAESEFAGYPHTLGAIVIAGSIMALFGLMKVGKFGDFFPSAAVHGMLAAIGVIIFIKQFYPAIGVTPEKGSILSAAARIPESLLHTNMYTAAISMVTLLILILHPLVKLRWTKAVPAPMWVMLLTIAMAQFFPASQVALVTMPEQLFGEGGIAFPSFSKIGEGVFWSATISIALVAAIESLLSAKAVDEIDPLKRKSNLNKDLFAMGSSSSIAALIGGLPMISEIVRSSANINNGAKTQWANFFHGIFLLIFLLLASSIINLIPLAALAAMLVFTGFRLASPKEFKHMFQIGATEFSVFVLTLLVTLATDLIIGIAAGIAFNFILLLFKRVHITELFKVKANVSHKDGHAVIEISSAVIFSNYLGLKKELDRAFENSDRASIDFKDCPRIDHTVMGHLQAYQRQAAQENKTLTLEGIEDKKAVSEHPLAERYS